MKRRSVVGNLKRALSGSLIGAKDEFSILHPACVGQEYEFHQIDVLEVEMLEARSCHCMTRPRWLLFATTGDNRRLNAITPLFVVLVPTEWPTQPNIRARATGLEESARSRVLSPQPRILVRLMVDRAHSEGESKGGFGMTRCTSWC